MIFHAIIIMPFDITDCCGPEDRWISRRTGEAIKNSLCQIFPLVIRVAGDPQRARKTNSISLYGAVNGNRYIYISYMRIPYTFTGLPSLSRTSLARRRSYPMTRRGRESEKGVPTPGDRMDYCRGRGGCRVRGILRATHSSPWRVSVATRKRHGAPLPPPEILLAQLSYRRPGGSPLLRSARGSAHDPIYEVISRYHASPLARSTHPLSGALASFGTPAFVRPARRRRGRSVRG